MSTPVTTFRTTENVGRIIDVLVTQPHNGFPVVDVVSQPDSSPKSGVRDISGSFSVNVGHERAFGRFRGKLIGFNGQFLAKSPKSCLKFFFNKNHNFLKNFAEILLKSQRGD
jgi:hypothetical protein